MTHPRSSLGLPLALVLAGCHTGPAWTRAELEQLAAMQSAVLRQRSEAALDTPAVLGVLPDGVDIDGVMDRHLSIASGHGNGLELVGIDGPTLSRMHCHSYEGVRLDDFRGLLGENQDQVVLALAGRLLCFADLDALGADAAGLVMLATRRGEQTVVAGGKIWSGQLWHREFAPRLSGDGKMFVYVGRSISGDQWFVAPTADPEHGTPIHFPGFVRWPVWLDRDGSRVFARVRVDGRWQVRENDRVLASAEAEPVAWYDSVRNLMVARLQDAGRERYLLGERLTPPLQHGHDLLLSRDGSHYAVLGSEGDTMHLLVDGTDVLQHRKIAQCRLAADGNAWAAVVEEPEGSFVVAANRRLGPFESVDALQLAPDGRQAVIRIGRGSASRWLCDDQPLGADYQELRHVELLPGGRGAVFEGKDQAGWWLVTPSGRDGPWDRIGLRWHGSGDRIVFLAQRGRTAHRRVVVLAQ